MTPVHVGRPENQGGRQGKFRFEGRLEPQEELMFQAESEGWERPRCQLRGEAERVPSYSCDGRPCSSQDFNELDEAHPPWGWGEFCFIQSTHSDAHRIRQQPPRHTQNDV